MANASPPASFQEQLMVPKADYRTAIAIKHDQAMKPVTATFLLREWRPGSASYAAPCPRCGKGEIVVEVKLTADQSFAEAPACPSLCLDCEDRLDSLLEAAEASGTEEEEGGRAALDRHIRAMNRRAWDR